jgi:3-oxoacyl-[acyl-carrier protein] reductase
LYGQVAIITGSGQGIGACTAHLFAREGAKVVVTDLDAVKSDKVAADIVSQGHTAISAPGDVTDPNFPQKIIDLTIKSFGKINIIVNNAGYTWDGMLHKITDKQWNAIQEVHTTAPFRLIRAASPHMRELSKSEKEKGLPTEPRCIINVSSTSGLHGNIGQANYATAKLGIVGLTKTIAKEWGPFGIRCNAVAFGLIDTRLTREKKEESINIDGNKVLLGIPSSGKRDYAAIPLQRPGSAEEAAAAVLFLASPLASYVNGHCLEVTGGTGI